MRKPRAQGDRPGVPSTSGEQRKRMADGTCRAPVWNRERLIEQFRAIDGSTRGEAEREVAAYEQSFGLGSAERAEFDTPKGRPGK